jgi:hypothetical protein
VLQQRRACRINFQTALFANTPPRPRGVISPGLCKNLRPKGRGECRAHDAPAAWWAERVGSRTSIVTTGSPGSPGIPAREWFTVYFVLSPVIGLSCHRRQRSCLRQLDTSVEASGPHDFAVRLKRRTSAALSASTASHCNVRDDRETRPSVQRDRERYTADLAFCKSEYFRKKDWTCKPA